MKNKKGQLEMGSIIMVAITLIVGVILLAASAQNLHPTLNTIDINNESFTGTLNERVAISGQAVTDTMIVILVNDSVFITTGNYTVESNQILNGALTATINVTTSYIDGAELNISYTMQPDGYSTSGGARSVAGIIIILFAVSIAVVALMPTVGSKIIESMGR